MFIASVVLACAHAGGGNPAPTTFSVAVPEGWKTIPCDEPIIFMTKDGGYKQFALVQERPLGKPFQFSQRTIRNDMLPHEAAEVVIGEIMSDQNIRDFSLLENVPATVAGNRGFRLMFLYKDADGFVFKTLYYGFIHGELFYNLRYGATQDELFEKDLKTFKQVFDSFRLVTAKTT
jgi:hypothetical protein